MVLTLDCRSGQEPSPDGAEAALITTHVNAWTHWGRDVYFSGVDGELQSDISGGIAVHAPFLVWRVAFWGKVDLKGTGFVICLDNVLREWMSGDISVFCLENEKRFVSCAAWVREGLLYGQVMCAFGIKVRRNRYFEGRDVFC